MECDTKRINYMDILKGMAIIMVVMGHCDAKGGKLIYLFHMPLFFFVSGYFYKKEYSKSPFKLLKRRISSLYVPFIKYEILFLVLHNLFYKINFYNLHSNVPVKAYNFTNIIVNAFHIVMFDGTELLLSPLWFLASLFLVTVLFCFICYFVDKIKKNTEYFRATIILVLFIIGNLLTYNNINVRNSLFESEVFNVSFVALIFFYVGFMYKQYEKYIKMSNIVAAISFILLCFSAKYNFSIDMRINYYSNIIMFLINAILGIYMIIYLSKKMDKLKFEFNLLKYIGRNTIIIMSLHLVCFKIVGIVQILIYKLPINRLAYFGNIYNKSAWWILYTIVGVLLPIIIKILYETTRNICCKTVQ